MSKNRGQAPWDGEDIPILSGPEIRRLKEGTALVLSENNAPMIAKLERAIAGRHGKRLQAQSAELAARTATVRRHAGTDTGDLLATALATSRTRGLAPADETGP